MTVDPTSSDEKRNPPLKVDTAAPQPEWFVSALACEAETSVVAVRGCDIAVRQWGRRGDPGVLLIHGGGAHARWWDHIAPLLASDRRVAAIDLSGHGDSGHRDRYTWDDWAEEVIAVASDLASDNARPALVAHSFGGKVMTKAAATARDDFDGIVFVDSPVGVISAASARLPRRPAARRFFESQEEALGRFRLRPEQEDVVPCVHAHVALHSITRTSEGWSYKVDPVVRDREGDVGPETLCDVACRVAVVRGEHGRVAADANRQLGPVLNQDVPVVTVPAAHHHVMIDQPLALAAALDGVLRFWSAGAMTRPDEHARLVRDPGRAGA